MANTAASVVFYFVKIIIIIIMLCNFNYCVAIIFLCYSFKRGNNVIFSSYFCRKHFDDRNYNERKFDRRKSSSTRSRIEMVAVVRGRTRARQRHRPYRVYGAIELQNTTTLR